MTTATNDKCLDYCNNLLAGELSAVETYDIAIDRFDQAEGLSKLSEIRSEHQESVTCLQSQVQTLGGTPTTASGRWGTFATTVEKAASLLGDDSAIGSLEQGEKHGISEYESALESEHVSAECKELISEKLLPRLHAHLRVLAEIKS